MAVYVDDMFATYGHMKMCHMFADSTGELLEFADKIGVARKWIQKQGTYKEHFDICSSKRTKALALGAVAITYPEGVKKLIDERKEHLANGRAIMQYMEGRG